MPKSALPVRAWDLLWEPSASAKARAKRFTRCPCSSASGPLVLPGVIATASFTFIVPWNDFLFALLLIGRDELKTLPVGINGFFRMAVVDWG
jgi:hypothetical protein